MVGSALLDAAFGPDCDFDPITLLMSIQSSVDEPELVACAEMQLNVSQTPPSMEQEQLHARLSAALLTTFGNAFCS